MTNPNQVRQWKKKRFQNTGQLEEEARSKAEKFLFNTPVPKNPYNSSADQVSSAESKAYQDYWKGRKSAEITLRKYGRDPEDKTTWNRYRKTYQYIGKIARSLKETEFKDKPIKVLVIGSGISSDIKMKENSFWGVERNLRTYQPEDIEIEFLKKGISNYNITSTHISPEKTEILEKRDKIKWLNPRIKREKFDILSDETKKLKNNQITVYTNVSFQIFKNKNILSQKQISEYESKITDALDKTTASGGYIILDARSNAPVINNLIKKGYFYPRKMIQEKDPNIKFKLDKTKIIILKKPATST